MEKDYIGKALERSKLQRERFTQSKVPESLANLVVVPFFGDMRSEFIFSTLILNHFKQKNIMSYLAVCSWPGHHGLYPYADEYWSFPDEATLVDFCQSADGFKNEKANVCERILLRFFDQVRSVDMDIIPSYYNQGLTAQYLKECQDVLYSLPSVPSLPSHHGKNIASLSKRIFVYPLKYACFWKHQKNDKVFIDENFWVTLCRKLLSNGYSPVILQNYRTHDISDAFRAGCAYVTESDLMAVMSVMRSCDCVLDIFSGVSRYAYVARAPVLICDERQRFADLKEFEIDDLCGRRIPRQYIFSFAPILEGDSRNILIDAILNKLDSFLPSINRDLLPSTLESSDKLSYSCVRKRQLKRIGARFIVPPQRDEDD